MGRQDVLITMFIFGALRIIKAGFTQRKVMHHIYQHSSLRNQGGVDILSRSTDDSWQQKKTKRLYMFTKIRIFPICFDQNIHP